MTETIVFDLVVIEPWTVAGLPFETADHTELGPTSATRNCKYRRRNLALGQLTMSCDYSLLLALP